MPLNFPKWISEYKSANPDESIKYRDGSGTWKEDKDYQFSSISPEIQQRGHIYRDELRKIGKWKSDSDGRVDYHLKDNNQTFVERKTAVAFQKSNDKESIELLTELSGVKVPIASTILTMYDPTTYAVVDYRAFRALGVAVPRFLDPQMYHDYAKFMEHFQNYNSAPQAYHFYMEIIRDIAQREGLLPREVDMALWAYDEDAT